MKTTKAQDAILNRLYREIEIRIMDGNQKKTVRSLSKKGLVEFVPIAMTLHGGAPFYFTVKLTNKGLDYTQTQH